MISLIERLRTLAALPRHPFVGREQIVSFRNRRLRQLVADAYENVPFYRKWYDEHGVRPEQIRSVDDLWRLPMVTRQQVQSMPARVWVARGLDPERLIQRKSSGSSGIPMCNRRTWLEERTLGLLRLRAMCLMGYRPTDRHVGVLYPHTTQKADGQIAMRLAKSMGLCRVQMVNCFWDPERILAALKELNPQVITGFPGVLTQVAGLITDRDRQVLRPRLITTGGEVVSPLMRRQIIQGFGAPLCDTYGSHEFNILAWQCPQTGAMHTCDDGTIIEILKDGRPVGPGERGEVVGTNLHSLAMPFIRYRLGDIVTRGAEVCECGAPFGTIAQVEGRMIDYLRLPGGRLMHPWEVMKPFLHGAWMRQYQLTQESESRITVSIVAWPAPPQEEWAEVQVRARALLGPGVEFSAQLVDRIPQEASGKFRYARSLVQSNYDQVEFGDVDRPARRSA